MVEVLSIICAVLPLFFSFGQLLVPATSTWKLEHEVLTIFSTQQSAPSFWWVSFFILKQNGERRSTNWDVDTMDEKYFKFATIHTRVTDTYGKYGKSSNAQKHYSSFHEVYLDAFQI